MEIDAYFVERGRAKSMVTILKYFGLAFVVFEINLKSCGSHVAFKSLCVFLSGKFYSIVSLSTTLMLDSTLTV